MILIQICIASLGFAQDKPNSHLVSKSDMKILIELNPEKTRTLLLKAQNADAHSMLLIAEAYWLGFDGLTGSTEDIMKWLDVAIQYGEKDALTLKKFLEFQKRNQDTLLSVVATLETGWKALERKEPLDVSDKTIIEALAYSGLPEAEAIFGLLAMNGQIDAEPDVIVDMLNDASQSNSMMTLEKIATAYQEGVVLEKNLDLATRIYLKAANLGSSNGQLMVAKIILQGKYLEFDLAEAIKWLELSANADNQEAIRGLENMKEIVSTTVWLEGFHRAKEWLRAR